MKVLEDEVAVLGKKLKGVAEELKELKMAGECSDSHHSITLSLSHTHTLTLTHSLPFSFSLSHTHSLTLSLTHTHTELGSPGS